MPAAGRSPTERVETRPGRRPRPGHGRPRCASPRTPTRRTLPPGRDTDTEVSFEPRKPSRLACYTCVDDGRAWWNQQPLLFHPSGTEAFRRRTSTQPDCVEALRRRAKGGCSATTCPNGLRLSPPTAAVQMKVRPARKSATRCSPGGGPGSHAAHASAEQSGRRRASGRRGVCRQTCVGSNAGYSSSSQLRSSIGSRGNESW